jgi:hypothetical protein
MDLVDEQDRARAALVASLGGLADRLAHVLDAGVDCGNRHELGAEYVTE